MRGYRKDAKLRNFLSFASLRETSYLRRDMA